LLDTDGKKLRGRFIKNKSPLLKKISLVDFNFQDVFEGDLTETDNVNRNIIHSKYHTEEEQKLFVSPPSFEIDLETAASKRPLLHPIDFTPEWEASRKHAKAKPHHEDEEFNMVFHGQLGAEGKDSLQEQVEETEISNAENSGVNTASEVEETPSARVQNMDIVGDAINNLVQTEEGSTVSPILNSDDPTVFTAAQSETNLDQEPETKQNKEDKNSNDDFIPAQTAATEEFHDPEDSPSMQYKKNVQSAVSQDEIKSIFDEAKSQGYEEGYKIGEQKAELQTRERTSKVFGKVGEIVKEFESLKHNILENVQENFYELSQAIAETLLKRELKLNPTAFAQVIRKAIEEAVEPNTFKIHVNPEMYTKVKELEIPEISNVLVKDDSIDSGDFRIESELSVVDGNIRKVIADLLDQADLNLFESDTTDEKAS